MNLTEKLEELKQIAGKATRGKWEPRVADKEIWGTDASGYSRRISTFFYPSGPYQKVDGQQIVRNHPQSNSDSSYIAAFHPEVALALVGAVEALQFADVSIDNYAQLRGINASMAVAGMKIKEALAKLSAALGCEK